MALAADNLRRIETHLLQSAEIKRQTAAKCADSIAKAADLIAQSFVSNGKMLLCGNGGSAADCQHMAAEFVEPFFKRFGPSCVAGSSIDDRYLFFDRFRE